MRQPKQKSSMPVDQFLFINKTANSTALTNNGNDASLKRRVYHHVQPKQKPARYRNSNIESVANKLVGWLRPDQTVTSSENSTDAYNTTQADGNQAVVQRRRVGASEVSARSLISIQQNAVNRVEQRRAPADKKDQSKLPTTRLETNKASEAKRKDLASRPLDGRRNSNSCNVNHEKSSNAHPGSDACPHQESKILGNKRLGLSNPGNATGHVSYLNEISGALDPFLRLPLELTLQERNLLQFCK